MLVFQLIGLGFTAMFFGALFTGPRASARR